jgi:hypothetical protein
MFEDVDKTIELLPANHLNESTAYLCGYYLLCLR